MLMIDLHKRLELYKKAKEQEDFYIFDSYADFVKYHLEHKDVCPIEKAYEYAVKEIAENAYINFSVEQVKDILSFYPYALIELAENEEVEFDCISHFFLGCQWPKFKDNININEFLEILHFQVKKIYPEVTFRDLD